MLVVDLPVGEPDPSRCLALIHRSTREGKARLRESGGDVSDLLHLPVPVARWIVRYGRRFGSSRITQGVTDVAGPPSPLWLAGARLEQAVPVAPLVPLAPLSVAALSYAGEFTVSVNADASIADVDVLGDGTARTFEALRELSRSTRGTA
ncbi:MAG TPA: WS/DGAT domain-containing protein [Kineosporiaceae bacterium]|nr:WS/DGAT domain-containing protein [Kineosporiaceae bacterium]